MANGEHVLVSFHSDVAQSVLFQNDTIHVGHFHSGVWQ